MAKQELEKAGCDSPAFDAVCLLEDVGGSSRGNRSLWDITAIPAERIQALNEALLERATGRPLQYILGSWEFLTLTLNVGEGVLIPRPDTELLCIEAAALLHAASEKSEFSCPQVLDLCAGSGCVALGIASLYPQAKITAIELSSDALPYLKQNIASYPQFSVTPIQADVLRDAALFSNEIQAIVSNPPYIPTDDLPSLMREVQHEPVMALDGGDGLVFYRAIADQWLPKLSPNGFCAVEAGIGQAEDVRRIFELHGLQDCVVLKDLNGIERVVIGFRKSIQ